MKLVAIGQCRLTAVTGALVALEWFGVAGLTGQVLLLVKALVKHAQAVAYLPRNDGWADRIRDNVMQRLLSYQRDIR